MHEMTSRRIKQLEEWIEFHKRNEAWVNDPWFDVYRPAHVYPYPYPWLGIIPPPCPYGCGGYVKTTTTTKTNG